MCSFLLWPKKVAQAGLLGLTFLISIAALAQDASQTTQDTVQDQPPLDVKLKAIPILSGSGAYFTKVTAGQFQNAPTISPILLVPIGDKLLLEGKGSFAETYSKAPDDDYFENKASYGFSYAQVDYITRYMTFTAGRFITPFNIYAERFAPNWIKALQVSPLTSPITSGSALGGMLRGGFPATDKINLNYAFYFSANNTHHLLATDRSTGGRVGFFVPGPRLELGFSYQQVLQADRSHSAGGYFVWQPNRVPLSLRSEFVRSSGTKGKAYWIESAYRLSQISALRRLELAARGEQFFTADHLSAATLKKLGAFGKQTKEGDFGLNYYFRSDVRASAGYGRQFIQGANANLWTIGMTYRFVMPLGPSGNRL